MAQDQSNTLYHFLFGLINSFLPHRNVWVYYHDISCKRNNPARVNIANHYLLFRKINGLWDYWFHFWISWKGYFLVGIE